MPNISPERLAEIESGRELSRDELAELVAAYRAYVKPEATEGWFFSQHEDSESWDGPYDTKDDAIQEARDQGYLKEEGDTIWVDIARLTTVEDLVSVYDDERMLNEFNEYLLDNDLCGEDNLVSIENKDEAFEVLAAWVRKYVKVSRYYVCQGQAECIAFEDLKA